MCIRGGENFLNPCKQLEKYPEIPENKSIIFSASCVSAVSNYFAQHTETAN